MTIADNAPLFITSADLARRWKMTNGAVQAMRRRGNGPPFVMLGPARIRYAVDDVLAFEQRRFTNLAEASEAFPQKRADAAKRRKQLGAKTRQAKIAKAKAAKKATRAKSTT